MRLAVPFSLEGRNQSRRSAYRDYEIEKAPRTIFRAYEGRLRIRCFQVLQVATI